MNSIRVNVLHLESILDHYSCRLLVIKLWYLWTSEDRASDPILLYDGQSEHTT